MHAVRACRGSLGAAALLLGAAAATAAPLDPPRQYRVSGSVEMTIAGPGCCGDARMPGQFRAAYQVASSGQVTLASLRVSIADTDLTVHDGFLGLFSETVRLRCPTFRERRPAVGTLAGADLVFPSGALTLVGFASDARLPSGACGPAVLGLDSPSGSDVRIGHDPAADRVELDVSFPTVLEGEAYAVRLRGSGRFDNRPPVARMQFETAASPQGVECPAMYQPNLGWYAEANAPAGLVARLRSAATDVDGPPGASSRSDLLSERWLRSRNAAPRALAGLGYRTEPQTFEWGPTHHVELLSMDLAGASDAADCSFRVVDTRPPAVTPPAPKTVACSQAGGASASTSPALRAFLEGGSAVDGADASPTRLAPQVGGIDVTGATLFPGDGLPRRVRFRYRDDWGHVGAADSDLTVANGPPTVAVTLSPAALAADSLWHPIHATIVAQDCDGPVVLKLHKITSNLPAHDATDVMGAAFGTDDRQFSLYGRRGPFGEPREYRVTYKGTDAAGHATFASATVTVY